MDNKCFCHFNGYEVKDAESRKNIENINKIIDKNANFYEEITYERKRVNNTNCYLVTIPKYDNENNLIDIYVANREGLSPNQYAVKNQTNVTINGSLAIGQEDGSYIDGSVIINGEIVRKVETSEIPSNMNYFAIKEDRVFATYPNTTTPEEMVADGVIHAILCFWQSGADGAFVEGVNYLDPGPGQYIGQKANGDVVILSTDGRNTYNRGLTGSEGTQVLLDEGCVNVWILDGGGSTSTSFRGTKLNMDVDDSGIKDRGISYLINVKKPIKNEQNSDVYSHIGKIRDLINDQLRPLINNRQKRNLVSFLKNAGPITINSTEQLFSWSKSSPTSNLILYNADSGFIELPQYAGMARVTYSGYVENTNSSPVNLNIGIKYSRTSTSNEFDSYKTVQANSKDIISFGQVLNCGVGAKVNIFASAPSELKIRNSRITVEFIPDTDEYVS